MNYARKMVGNVDINSQMLILEVEVGVGMGGLGHLKIFQK